MLLGMAPAAYLSQRNLPQEVNVLNAPSVQVEKYVPDLLTQEGEMIGVPVQLLIPKIGIRTGVIPVGTTLEGEMEVPERPDEVAWFHYGPRPGEIGSAVLAGHFGWKNNIPAVFDNLHKLREGDEIFVVDEDDTVITFVVREIRMYDKDESSFDVFVSNDGKAHLNLITCSGDWNVAERSRPQRLVVFTDRQ